MYPHTLCDHRPQRRNSNRNRRDIVCLFWLHVFTSPLIDIADVLFFGVGVAVGACLTP